MASIADQLLAVLNAAPAAARGDWSAVATSVGRQAIGVVEIRTQVSPPIVVDPFAPAPPETGPNPVLAFVRPEFVIRDPSGAETMRIAPYGAPTENYFPWLVAAGVTLVVGAVTIAGAVGAALSRRRARGRS